jgi:hypothetical protein
LPIAAIKRLSMPVTLLSASSVLSVATNEAGGVSQDGFPGSGQFIGPLFTLEDAVTWHNKQTK